MKTMLEIKHLRKSFEEVTPLRDVNCTISQGEVVSVIGPSGTGKSTLLRCINGLERPTDGEILYNGKNIFASELELSEARKHIGMVFQSFNLFPHLTVLQNVMQPQIDLRRRSKQEAYDKAAELLKRVGMYGHIHSYPETLSGGQQQRVAIARTVSMDPEIILFDEPTSALDPTMVGEVQAVIRDLAGMGKTMMIVTHEMKFARQVCNRVFYMDQGGIYEDGTPERVFGDPQKELTRRFIRHINALEIVVEDRYFDFNGAVSSLTRYGLKNQVPPRSLYRIQAVFEELCQQILIPRIENPKILFAAEYEEDSGKVSVSVHYNGEPFDPRTSENTLAVQMISGLTEDINYRPSQNHAYTNLVTFKL